MQTQQENNKYMAKIRKEFPEYSDIDDVSLAKGYHKKYYADMKENVFLDKIGLHQNTLFEDITNPVKKYYEDNKDKNLGDIVFGESKTEHPQEQNKTPEPVEKTPQPQGESESDRLYRNMIENPIAPNTDGTMPQALPPSDPLHQIPQTKEEAIQKANEVKQDALVEQKYKTLENQDLPLEDESLYFAFPAGGATRAVQGAVAKTVAKTTAEKLAAEKMIAGGQAFAKGDIVGNVAAQGAMGATDTALSDDFKKEYPLTAGLLELGAGLAVGGFAGIKAENGVKQKYQTLADNVRNGKVSLGDAEKVLYQDTTFMQEYKKANKLQAEKKAEDDAEKALTPEEKSTRKQTMDEFLQATKPQKVSEDSAVTSHVDDNGQVILDIKKSEPKQDSELDQIDNGWKELDTELHGENGVIKEDIKPKGIKEELPLSQQLLNTQSEINESLRKAKFEESVDNLAGAKAHKENADILTKKAQELEAQIKLQETPKQEPQTPQDPIIDKPRVGEPEPEAKASTVDEMLQHPRLNELLDMRKDVLAKDIQSPNKLVSKGAGRELDGHNGTDKMTYDPAQYERNYAYDFELTKQDVKKIKEGKVDDKVAGKLEHDLGVLDNHPDYAPVESKPTKEMSKSDWDKANTLFSKGLDNAVVATYAGVDKDENGNYHIDKEKFLLGLGGYSAVKMALKNKLVQGKLKEYAQKAIDTVDMNPAVHKENGLNSMFVGSKGNEKSAFSDVATQKAMKEIDDSKALWSLGNFKDNKAKLGDILDNKELYKKYPELKNIKVEVNPNLEAKGQFIDTVGAGKYIIIKDRYDISTVMHEVQHAIQKEEGWAKGGSLKDFTKATDLLQNIRNYHNAKEEIKMGYESSKKDLTNALLKIEKILGKNPNEKDIQKLQSTEEDNLIEEAFKKYKSLWGEQQARATQLRAEMTPEQRAKESWTDTLKRVEGEYNEPIVKFDSSVAESATKPMTLKEKKDFKNFWGLNHTTKAGKGQDAVNYMLEKKSGHIVGAFKHKELGDIDLVWGDKNSGLMHILSQRTKQWGEKKALAFIKHLSEIVEDGVVEKVPKHPTRVLLVNPKSTAVIELKYNQTDKNWLMSAYKDSANKKKFQPHEIHGEVLEGEPIVPTAKDGTVLSPETSHETIIPQKEESATLHANAGHTLAGAFAGGADSEINQRDYNGDGKHDFKDVLLGAGTYAVGINALKKVKPTWFEDGFVRGEKGTKIGVFAGDGVTVSNKAQKAFNKGELKGAESLPDETKLQLIQRKMQDKFNRVKQLINHKASMDTIDDVMNPYQKEELMHKKVETKLIDFETQTVTPIIEKIGKAKLTTEKVDEYLWARHAPERNKAMYELHQKPTSMTLEDVDAILLKYKDSEIGQVIKEAKKNDNSFFGKFSQKNVDEYEKVKSEKRLYDSNAKISKSGSGMSNDEAYRIINKYKDNKAMNEIVQDVYAMNRSRLRLIQKEGLESADFIQKLEGLYDNYVPLRREFGTADKAVNVGKGFDVKGHETKKARGSDRAVESPLMHSILAYEETIVRAGKNEVGKSFLKFAEEFPDEDLYSIGSLKHKAVFDKNGAVVNVDALYKKDDNVLHVKVDGKIKEITIHDPALASAFKNLNSAQMGAILKASHRAIRLIASVNTAYNPEFVISNFERDIQTALINMPDNIKGNRLKLLKDVGFAMRGIYKHSVQGKDNEWGKLYNELKHEGGTTGWHEIHSVQDITKSTKAMLNKYNGVIVPKETAKKVLNYIDNVNDAVENSTRLVAYKMAKESGLSNAKSASIAKNLTVNFNRSGEWSPTLNSLYMFYNASVQGTARMMMQLKNSHKAQGIVGGIAGVAIGFDTYNRSVNKDAYNLIPDYIKDTNYILMNKDGSYETMQLPYGYNMFKAIGDIAAEAYHGEIKLEDIPTRLLKMSVNAFSPIGVDSDSLIHTVLPTLAKPVYEVEQNKNFFGGNIRPEDNPFAPKKPDSQKYFKNVNPLAKSIAQGLNKVTGGNMVKKGSIDVSPESIEHMVGFATGGLGRLITNAYTTGSQAYKGEKVDKNKIPFARKFYHVPRPKEEVNLVYRLAKKSGDNMLSSRERKRFYKWAQVAYDKKDLTQEQYKKLTNRFKENQALQDFAQKYNLQDPKDYTKDVEQDSYKTLSRSQILRILREKEKGK